MQITRDRALPQLEELLDPQKMECRISQILKTQVRVVELEVVKYKPGRRCVVRYTLTEPVQRTLYAKTFYNDRGEKIYARMQALEHAIQRQGTELYTPQTLAYIGSLRLLLQEGVPGRELGAYLLEGSKEHTCRLIARSLAALHSLNLELDIHHTPKRELEPLQRFLPQLRERYPALRKAADEVYTVFCRELENAATSWGHTPIHRDFYHTQILIEGVAPKIYFIDLDELCLGEPAIDVGNFTGHLRLLGIEAYRDPEYFEPEIQAFLNEYIDITSASCVRIAAFELGTLLRLAGIHGLNNPYLAYALLEYAQSRF